MRLSALLAGIPSVVLLAASHAGAEEPTRPDMPVALTLQDMSTKSSVTGSFGLLPRRNGRLPDAETEPRVANT